MSDAHITDEERLVSLSFSDLVNMTLLGDESFYRCEPVDAVIERLEADKARLQALGDELVALLEEARGDRDGFRQRLETVAKFLDEGAYGMATDEARGA